MKTDAAYKGETSYVRDKEDESGAYGRDSMDSSYDRGGRSRSRSRSYTPRKKGMSPRPRRSYSSASGSRSRSRSRS